MESTRNFDLSPFCCTICFERYEDPTVLNCGHTFCRECVNKARMCPICKANISSRVINYQFAHALETKVSYTVDSSDDEKDLLEKYWQDEIFSFDRILDWRYISRGIRIAFMYDDSDKVHRAWVHDIDIDREMILLYMGRNEIMELSVKEVKRIWSLSSNTKNKSKNPAEQSPNCGTCVIC